MPRRLDLLYGLAGLLVVAALIALWLHANPAWAIALLALAIVLLVLFRLTLERLAQRADEMTVALRSIENGQYGREIVAAADGSLGAMGRAFNAMSIRLAQQFAAVEQDRQQLRAILGGMVEGVVAIDGQQRLLFANERGSQLLEFNPRTTIGLRFWEVVRQRPVVGIVEKALESHEPQRLEIDWKGNPAKSMVIYVSPLKGGLGGAIIVLHDTSELRRLERLRHEFVANVSHELKTPLAVIKAAVETLQDGAVDDVEYRGTFLEQIHDQTDRLHSLILDLLSLARIESGAETMEVGPVVIADAVQDCFDRHQARAESHGQRLEMEPPAEPSAAELRTDAEAFAQILDNLVDNALKYTQDGSRVRVRWYGVGDQIVVEVQDDGPGIPAEDLPRIFERFYRVDKARSRELGGTGLGLAIVKNLAHILKGTARVSSEPGRGATFTISLPRTPP